jgi:hypothetical protein
MARLWFAPKGGTGLKTREYWSVGVLEKAFPGI